MQIEHLEPWVERHASRARIAFETVDQHANPFTFREDLRINDFIEVRKQRCLHRGVKDGIR
jgi:hypothetical protein